MRVGDDTTYYNEVLAAWCFYVGGPMGDDEGLTEQEKLDYRQDYLAHLYEPTRWQVGFQVQGGRVIVAQPMIYKEGPEAVQGPYPARLKAALRKREAARNQEAVERATKMTQWWEDAIAAQREYCRRKASDAVYYSVYDAEGLPTRAQAVGLVLGLHDDTETTWRWRAQEIRDLKAEVEVERAIAHSKLMDDIHIREGYEIGYQVEGTVAAFA